MARIAVIDDKEILRESLDTALTREDHTVTTFDDPVDALEALKRERYDVILTDMKMPRMDGIALIRELGEAGCDTPVVVMTAFATVSTAVEAMKIGAFDYVQKPFEVESILVLIERAIEHGRLRRENEAYRASIDDLHSQRQLVGSGRAMTSLRAQLDQVAASHATVLICGESGTGKELVSGYIQRHSPRATQPMLCLNCAALSANLLESELFGHERGAFTGADRTRRGRFELADGGTLLLDEISELSPNLQAKLLRVLQHNASRGRARDRNNQSRSTGVGGQEAISRGPLLSFERTPADGPRASAAEGRHSGTDWLLHGTSRQSERCGGEEILAELD
jgi:DNA-binding NtrC family response regulator